MTHSAQQQQQSASHRSASQKQPAPQPLPPIQQATVAMHSSLHEEIAVRAYGIYERKGRVKGQCQQNWDQAELELRKQQSKSGSSDYRNTPLAQRDGTDPIGKNYDEVLPSGMAGNIAKPGSKTPSSTPGSRNKL